MRQKEQPLVALADNSAILPLHHGNPLGKLYRDDAEVFVEERAGQGTMAAESMNPVFVGTHRIVDDPDGNDRAVKRENATSMIVNTTVDDNFPMSLILDPLECK